MHNKQAENDPFEIVDHTSASPWESFITSIEDLLHIWDLHAVDGAGDDKSSRRRKGAGAGAGAGGKPGHTFELLSFGGASYTLRYFFNRTREPKGHEQPYGHLDDIPDGLQRLVGSRSSDFAADGTYVHLQRWFGLSDFLMLAPTSEATVDPSQAKLLLSSLSIALSNTGCNVPAFVGVNEPWRQQFVGYALVDGVQVRFDTTMLNFIPRSHAHLAGLADLFGA